jgi:outer membrane protein
MPFVEGQLHNTDLLTMSYLRNSLAIFLAVSTLCAQSAEVSILSPKPPRIVGPILRPFHFEKRLVTPAKLNNSPRLEQLVRSGILYLSVQDVIALALENNLDIAVQRYSPLLAREAVRRAQGGGLLRGTDSPVAAGPTSVSTAGVSTNANGLGGGSLNAGGSVVTQVGPNPPNLDPNISMSFSAGHQTIPQTNLSANSTEVLTDNYVSFGIQYSQQFMSGTYAQLTFANNRNIYNSANYLFNPNLTGYLDFYVSQPLLQGASLAVNNRDIRVAKNNLKVTDMIVKQQVITTIAAVLNLYWDLVTFNDAVRIKQEGLEIAQKLLEDNRKQVAAGALPSIELTRAAAAVSSGKEDLLFAQTNVAQQEIVLKNALSRNAIQNAWLDEVHIVPLDHIVVPKTDELKSVPELVEEALANRPEIDQAKLNLQSQEIMVKGDRNGVLPSVQAFAEFTNHGLSGPVNPLYNGFAQPNTFFVGGDGNVIAQILRRNFPDYSAGFSLNIPLRNRQAQADYVTDELLLRQAQLRMQGLLNQVKVDVKTAAIGLQQARARYQAAVDTRVLAEQNLKNEQQRFQFGASSVALVIQAQNDLAANQTIEVQAIANYSHARIALDQALGRTLDVNHVSMDEAISGKVQRESSLPATLPPAIRQEVRR